LLAQKRIQKGTRLSRPPTADTLRFSLLEGRKKTQLRLKQFLRLSPLKAVMLSAKERASKASKSFWFLMTILRSRAAHQKK